MCLYLYCKNSEDSHNPDKNYSIERKGYLFAIVIMVYFQFDLESNKCSERMVFS